MSSTDKVDIHSLHAELLHAAAEIIVQLSYDNGGSPATITDLTKKCLQQFIEEYLSKTGLPVKGEQPFGVKNRVNLTYTTAFEFIPETFEVFLSCGKLNGDPLDPDRDYDIISVGPNANKGFILRIDPQRAASLNGPPHQDEALYVNYGKRITFNTKGGT